MEFNSVCIDLEKALICDDGGLKLEVIQHPHSLRHVANIIVALQRMKHIHTPRGTEFSDDDLIDIMLENVIEAAPHAEDMRPTTIDTLLGRPSVFSKTELVPCSVCDHDQKSLVLRQTPLELQAVILQGGSMDLKVNVNLSMYKARHFIDNQRRPVTLGIIGHDLYLSCSEYGGHPILQLEEVKDRAMLKNIDAQGDMARFLFLKREEGFSGTNFESLKFRGWFISTAMEDKRPVEMCEKDDSARFTNFTIKRL